LAAEQLVGEVGVAAARRLHVIALVAQLLAELVPDLQAVQRRRGHEDALALAAKPAQRLRDGLGQDGDRLPEVARAGQELDVARRTFLAPEEVQMLDAGEELQVSVVLPRRLDDLEEAFAALELVAGVEELLEGASLARAPVRVLVDGREHRDED